MKQEERIKIIAEAIPKLEKFLEANPLYCGTGLHSDVYKLPDGRSCQISVGLNLDEDDFDESTKEFL